MAPCLAPVLNEGFECSALNTVGKVGDGGADDLVATADCKCLEKSVQSRIDGVLEVDLGPEQSFLNFRACLKPCRSMMKGSQLHPFLP